jgi:translation initiation factor 3 subunit B
MPRDRFGQLSWRPRVPSLLPREKEEEIRKNLKEYSRRYDEEDEALLLQVRTVGHLRINVDYRLL